MGKIGDEVLTTPYVEAGVILSRPQVPIAVVQAGISAIMFLGRIRKCPRAEGESQGRVRSLLI